MTEQFIERLKKLAKQKTCFDDFDGSDTPNYYCGNFDDCYNMGVDDGKIELARDILTELNIPRQ